MKNRNRVFAAGALLVFLLSTLFFWKINPASALTEAWIDEAELGQMCIRQVIPSAGKLETAENTETNDGQDNKIDAVKPTLMLQRRTNRIKKRKRRRMSRCPAIRR